MGKSAKKKRQKERLRLQQLGHSASVAPLLSTPTSTQQHDESPSSSDVVHQSQVALNESDASTIATRSPPTERKFGSTASRTRTLPTVPFVYPRGSNQSVASPRFEFEKGLLGKDGTGSIASSPQATSERSLTNPPTNSSKQSIDDILYAKKHPQPQQHQPAKTKTDHPRHEAPLTAAALHPPLHNGGRHNEHSRTEPSSAQSESEKLSPKRRARSSSDVSLRSVESDSGSVRSPYLSGISVEEAVRDKVGLRPRSNSTDAELKLPRRGLCDERSVLETYQWRNNNSIAWNMPPKGFNNLGNTCFLNSTLQCLAYCPPFCQSIMALSMPSANGSGPAKQTNQGKRITVMLGALFRQVHSVGKTDNDSHHSHGSFGGSRAISPSSIVRAMPTLGSHRNNSGYKFRPGRQEDVHEFLVHLLDAMNDGELREAGINAQKSGWRDRLPVPRLDETTFVHRIFGGYLRSQVRCTACGYCSNTYDPFLDLSLEISRKSCHSVAAAISEFTRQETLDSANRWRCSGCKKAVCATKQLTVFRPPLSMCIQLKRFSYGGFGGGGGFGHHRGGKKIAKPIEFPATLTLPLSDGRSCGYQLTGIVIHVGGTASSGHYTAYVKRPGKNGGEKWYHLDDSFVQPVTENDVLRQRDAYMLMYCRKEVKVAFPTPPLRGSMTAEEAKQLNQSRARARSEALKGPSILTAADASSTQHKAASKEAKSQQASQVNADSRETKASRASSVDKEASRSQVVPIAAVANIATSPIVVAGKRVVEAPSLPSASGLKEAQSQLLHQAVGCQDTPKPNGALSTGPPHGVNDAASAQRKQNRDASKSPKGNGKRITLDRGVNGKVEVMLEPRFKTKKPWQPKTLEGKKDEGFALLGNFHVSKWDEPDDKSEKANGSSKAHGSPESADVRAHAVKEIDRADQQRKRRLLLDRHDSLLDQGKTKKVKNKASSPFEAVPPSENRFQHIHESLRVMNKGRGRGKGYMHLNKSSPSKKPRR